jgi:hypothetical protein
MIVQPRPGEDALATTAAILELCRTIDEAVEQGRDYVADVTTLAAAAREVIHAMPPPPSPPPTPPPSAPVTDPPSAPATPPPVFIRSTPLMNASRRTGAQLLALH